MTINIEITEKELRKLVADDIEKRLGDIGFRTEDVHIQVKSKQNYKSEWEEAAFRATISINT